jgi:hypothetical protein
MAGLDETGFIELNVKKEAAGARFRASFSGREKDGSFMSLHRGR